MGWDGMPFAHLSLCLSTCSATTLAVSATRPHILFFSDEAAEEDEGGTVAVTGGTAVRSSEGNEVVGSRCVPLSRRACMLTTRRLP